MIMPLRVTLAIPTPTDIRAAAVVGIRAAGAAGNGVGEAHIIEN